MTAGKTNLIKETRQMETRIPATFMRRCRITLAMLAAMVAYVLAVSPAYAGYDDYGLHSETASISTDQAGGYPDFETKFMINSDPTDDFQGQFLPWARLRSIATELPPGLLGNPSAFPACPSDVFAQQVNFIQEPDTPLCSSDSIIGMIRPGLNGFFDPGIYRTPLYNLEAPGGDSGIVARFGFIAVTYPLAIDVRLDPKRDNALTADLVNIPAITALTGSFNTFWGVPTDSSHDEERFNFFEAIACEGPCGGPNPSGLPQTPFMINPTSCGPAEVGMSTVSYQRDDGPFYSGSPLPDIAGCEQVPFQPTLDAKPTTRSAAASSGVDLSIRIPQDGLADPNGRASAHLKKAVVTLPEGVSLNPSAAGGLGSCTEEQIGLDRDERQIVAIRSEGAPLRLSFGGQQTTEIDPLATAPEVQAALEGLPNVAPGDVAVTGRRGGPWTVDFVGGLTGHDVPEIAGVHSELQRLGIKAVGNSAGGTYTVGFEGEQSGDLPHDADAATVQAALESLPGIAPGDVEVSRGVASNGFVFRIAFRGGLSQTDLPELTTTNELTGQTDQFSIEGDTFAKVWELAKGGSPVSVKTVKQGGTIGFDANDPSCPNSSKIASGEITTPVLGEPLVASVYVAKQDDNPFNSMYAGYLVAKGAGAILKMPGKFDLDPGTGRIVTTFEPNPQQPFSDLELQFKSGNRGLVTTPDQCGTYQTSYELTPWSGQPPVVGTSEFTIDENCGPQGFAPGFSAGSANPLAGAYTTFATQVTRSPGMPRLTGVAVNPPLGLTGKLAGIPYCPDAALAAISTAPGTGAGETASPSCPAASQVGTAATGAGSGAPFYVQAGRVYLAGPYKGAPISLAIVTPVVAGPFDLGNVVVRAPVQIDPATVQLRVVSDPIPTIRHGVPLDIRDLRISLDRSAFTLNPTSCQEKAATGVIAATGGAGAQVQDRFQVGECAALGFKPKMSLRLKGGTKRGKHPALTVIMRPRGGDANISRISVSFPRSMLLDQSHIGTVCTRAQFAADACPRASIYGKVLANSPLLDYPLRGNVYLRSSSNKLPDLVTDLRAPAHQPIRIEAAGRTDSVRGGLRNTFTFVPDAPLSRVVLRMRGGNKGLLQNSTNICRKAQRATVRFAAHNGRTLKVQPKLHTKCAKGRKGKRRARRR